MKLLPVPAFSDNYLWLWQSGTDAVVVDPGDAEPVLKALSQQKATLRAILVTHHHADHVGGVQDLQAATGARVLAPAAEGLSFPHESLSGGDTLELLGLKLQVIDVPGHTAGHIAYWIPASPLGPVLFCGDTLFSGGCGRIFEGTPAQMLQSMDTLAALPADTLVCCAHEYTLSNLAFAKAVEPDNAALLQYDTACQAMRQAGRPTLPSSIGLERLVNPFLRSREHSVVEAVQRHDPAARDDVSVFAALRSWKNNFK
ncbi:MAG: hydroxyacylglutathione hydrolase [Limnohabitans sp.]|jgi:hydroxyacylglutathione hydrolase